MSIYKKIATFIIATLLSAVAVAHSNHSHRGPITQNQAESKVERLINRLVDQKKLDNSWTKAQQIEVKLLDKTEGKVWFIQYKNDSVSDANNSSLYVVLDEMGNTISATHSEPK